ncbi:MAG: HAD-IIIA family hydrolase [Phycisphaerales bacterium]|nr:HAD-IIIA family hydrolase [Phycisphaerales bacterium]
MRCAVFLDRDNTLIANDGDLGDPAQVRLITGAAWAVRALHEAGYTLVVVTNQGGVARGRYTDGDVDAVHKKTEALLAQSSRWSGGRSLIERWMSCPFHPDGTVAEYRREHPWRKPAPGMLIAAAADLAIDLSHSWMVGDQERDIEAGRAAGCRTILVHPDAATRGDAKSASGADFVECDLLHASHRIMRADGKDGGARWEPTSAVRLVAAPGQLGEARVRTMVSAVAAEIAAAQGVILVRCEVCEGGADLEVVGPEIVVLGLAAELRRRSNLLASGHGECALWMHE